jgi:hypothetical protein
VKTGVSSMPGELVRGCLRDSASASVLTGQRSARRVQWGPTRDHFQRLDGRTPAKNPSSLSCSTSWRWSQLKGVACAKNGDGLSGS